MSLTYGALIFLAAFVAGVMNSIAGGGTLITFPVLIWLGLDSKIANATSTVALWPGALSGAWGFRRELQNTTSFLVRLGVISVVGGGVGAWLLIITPTTVFEKLVPFLILFATLLFMFQERIRGRLTLPTTGPSARWWLGATAFQFATAIYGGYFGAGMGIMMLATLGLIGLSDIHQANGIKNLLAVCINTMAVIGFALSSLVHWPEALLMAVGAVGGGYAGAHVAKRFGRIFVRRAIVVIGFTIGFVMLWRTIIDKIYS